MGRFVGGVFGNTIGSDTNLGSTTGVFSSTDQYYLRAEGNWIIGPGEEEANPAASAKAIYDFGTRTNGVYWLKHGGNAAYQTWCWLDSDSGGGYHLVAKIASNNPSEWHYTGGNWTTSSEITASNLQNLNDNNGVNNGFYNYTLQTGFRMCLHSSAVSVPSNYLIEGKTGNSPQHFFTTSDGSSQNSRADYKGWISGAGSGFDNGFNSNFDSCQANCNQYRFYQDTGHGEARWGGFGNNENDCNSVDSSIGFGCDSYAGNMASGGNASHCGSYVRGAIGYIFVQ